MARACAHRCVYTFLLPHALRVQLGADFSALIRGAERAYYRHTWLADDSHLQPGCRLWTSQFVHLVRYGDERDLRSAYERFQARRLSLGIVMFGLLAVRPILRYVVALWV